MKIGPLLPCFFFLAYGSSTPVYAETTGNPSVAETSKKTSTHDLIRHLLDQDLGTRKFSFPDVVMASSGKKVIPSDSTNLVHQLILDSISKGANEAIAALSAIDSPVRKLRRINEASRFFEDWLRQSINKHPSLVCSVPKNTQGKEQRSGYPDLLITYTATDGATTRAYLDPKLFEKKSQASSFRTFYFEPCISFSVSATMEMMEPGRSPVGKSVTSPCFRFDSKPSFKHRTAISTVPTSSSSHQASSRNSLLILDSWTLILNSPPCLFPTGPAVPPLVMITSSKFST
jgi:hypothetical protein